MRQRAFVVLISVCAGMAGAVVLSAQVTTTFKADRERLRTAARALAVKRGLTEGELLGNAISSPFKGPVAKIQEVLPGGSVSVAVTGDFPAGTRFLSERDAVAISGAAQTTNAYSARLTIPPDEAPGYVRLFAITPVGIEGFAAVALVDTFYRFDLKSPDGYTIKITPLEKTFTIDNVHASAKYQAEFYKPGETKPFETLTGDQTFDPGNSPFESHTPYARLDIELDKSAGSPQAELEELNKKMADPKTSTADRNAAMARMMQIQTNMLEQMTKALQTDPASLNKEQDDFGCGLVQMYPDKGVIVDGNISCGKNFHGGDPLKITGTMTQVR
jgi:hypothetical protein